jgi:NAD(P)H-flavin reductase
MMGNEATTRVRHVGPDVQFIDVDISDTHAQSHGLPGQYTQVTFAESDSRKYLACANAPGMSPWTWILPSTTTVPRAVSVSLAQGRGIAVPSTVEPLLLVAMGTGLSPLLSLLSTLTSTQWPLTTLLLGMRQADRFVDERVDVWRARGVHCLTSLSQPPSGWAGLVGRVQGHVPQAITAEHRVVVVGNRIMQDDVATIAAEAGVARDRVLFNA